MKSPMSSNLVYLIERAIDDCYYNGEASVDDGRGLGLLAEWVDSKNEGYSVMHLTLTYQGVVKLAYDDYGTECVL